MIMSAVALLPMSAQDALIKLTTDAPAGTELRIYTSPFNEATVSGADKSEYFGTYLSQGPGTEITIAGNVEQLEVYGCHLTAIDVQSAPKMYILKCYDNAINSLKVDNCPELAVLYCQNNALTTLDLSACSKLENVNASHNNLTSMTTGTQPLLEKLYIGYNALEALNLSGCSALADLQVEHNYLADLDLSANTKLWWLHIFANRFSEPGAFIEKLPTAAQSPGMIYVVDEQYADEANYFLMSDVSALSAKGWVACDYDGGTDHGYMIGQFYNGADYVPTISEQTITFTTSRTVGQTINLEIAASNSITIDGVAETSYLGKRTFTLTNQTVTIKGDVTELDCSGCDLTSLTISENSKLTYLDCHNNAISSLEVIDAGSLAQLHCQQNALEHMVVSGCNGLYRINCYINKLKGSEMRTFVNSLYYGQATNPYLFIIDTKAPNDAEGNVATVDDVKVATDKGWSVFDYINGDRYGMGTPYAGSESGDPILPEQYFTFTRPTADYTMMTVKFADSNYTPVVEGAEIAGWNGEALTLNLTENTVKVYGDATELLMLYSQLSAIDVTHLPHLASLNVALNDITALDLSGNAALTSLSCEMNLLTDLDLSACPALNYLNCYGNQIAGQGMDAMIASLPQRDFNHFGELIVIDSDYDDEANVCTRANVQAASAKLWITYDLHSLGDMTVYEGSDASMSDIAADNAQSVHYYNLQGIEVSAEALTPGIYIRRQGDSVAKIRLSSGF